MQKSTSMKSIKNRSRSRLRAVALAESAFVMPVLAVLFSASLYWTDAYVKKIDQIQQSRRDLSYYTTHNCDEELSGSKISTGESLLTNTGTSTNSGANGVMQQGSGESEQAAMSKKTMVAKANLELDVSAKSSPYKWKSHLKTSSYSMCNQKPASGIGGFFSAAKDIFAK